MVIVSASEDAETIRHCLDCGASGFHPEVAAGRGIRDAIRRDHGRRDLAAARRRPEPRPPGRERASWCRRLSTLTPQQVRVLMMLGEGLLNKQIAFKLGVSEATIKAHVSAILQKLRRRQPHAGRDRHQQDPVARTAAILGRRAVVHVAAAKCAVAPPGDFW